MLGLIAALSLLRLGMAPAQAAPFAYIALTIDDVLTCALPSAVAVLDTATNAVIATVPVAYPVGVAVHPAGTFVYVTNLNSATVSVIAPATNTVVAAVPVGNLPTTFDQFVGPELPGVSLTLNPATFHRGNTLTLQATAYAGVPSRRLDAYVEVQLPDETRLFLQADGRFTRETRPIVSDCPGGPFSGEIFRHTFAGAEPSGSYRWRSYFTEPGSSNMVGSIAEAAFTFVNP